MKKSTWKRLGKDLLVLILVAVCIIEGIMLKMFVFSGDSSGIANSYKMKQIKAVIDKYYLEEVDEEAMREYTYKGMVAALGDPYSAYYTEDEFKQLEESTAGVFSGVGLVLMQDPDTRAISVVNPIKNSPGEKAGIKSGDILYKVEGKEISAEEDLNSVVARVKGKEGTKVKLTFLRGEKETEYTLTRKKIETPTIEFEMLEDKTGYIKITEFDEITVDQFEKAVDQLEEDGMEQMVIDLRDNPGGLLTSVIDIADQILPTGLLVYTETKDGTREEYNAKTEECIELPIAVLVNGNSASASEILAGAIQDYDAGIVVGTTSFGKGIVQNLYQLGDGSAVKLTISTYYTPKGRNIHKKGIEPDVQVDLKESLKTKTEVKKSEDNQLQRALKELNQ